jgi:hypothetical protein
MAAISCADAELIAAGVEFRILHELFVKATRLSRPHFDAQEAAVQSGIYSLEDLKRIEHQWPPLPVPSCDDITGAMGPAIDKIVSLPATTVEGLAAKADLVVWSGFDDQDWGGERGTVEDLVKAVYALAGRSPQDADIASEAA